MSKYKQRFKKQLDEINSVLISDYTKTTDKHKILCKVCNCERYIEPCYLNQGRYKNCINCIKKESLSSLLEKLQDSDYTLVNESEFINKVTKISVRCKSCNTIKNVIPSSILSGEQKRCAICIYNRNKEAFIKLAQDNDFTLAEEFTSMRNKHKMICGKGHINYKTSSNLKAKSGCKECYYKELRVENLKSFNNLLKEEGYYLISYYHSTKEKVMLKNLKCNHQSFFMKPADFIYNNQRCPQCNSSKGERAIAKLLTNNNIYHLSEHTFDDLKYERLLQLDFYLPDYNLIIEFDGEHHFEPIVYNGDEVKALKDFKLRQIRDQIKNEYAEKNGINMLRIPYWELENVDTLIEEKLSQINKGSGHSATI